MASLVFKYCIEFFWMLVLVIIKCFSKFIRRTKDEVVDYELCADNVETLEGYLNLAKRCLHEAQVMTLSQAFLPRRALIFNFEQCKHLLEKSKVAIEHAQSFLDFYNSTEYLASQDKEKHLEIFKLLFVSTKEVESYIQECYKFDAWNLTIINILPNSLEYISSICFDLELCIAFFSFKQISRPYINKNFIVNYETMAQIIGKKASLDKMALLTSLKLIEANNEQYQLASFLLQRLEGRVHSNNSKVWKVDYKCLEGKEKLARGGSDLVIVYKAMWHGAPVAIKEFHVLRNYEVFRKEVEILQKLSHPNIISMYCSAIDKEYCAIVMELMDQDLHSLIADIRRNERSAGPLLFTSFDSVKLILQIAKGMLYLHEKKIVHRDLKSPNILVKCVKITSNLEIEHVRAKVADFGLSKIKSISNNSNQTPNVGTPRWMAPEVMLQSQTSGDKKLKYDPYKSDVYSFAMVCYEILTGYMPFWEDMPSELKPKVVNGERPKLPDECPQKLKDLIEKCWHQTLELRPSFQDICEELNHLKCLLVSGCALNYTDSSHIVELLKLTTKCMEKVQAMASESLKLKYELCKFLVDKLERAVIQGHSYFAKDMGKNPEIFRLLFTLATQTENYIQAFCKLDLWCLASLILPNIIKHVSLLYFDLELCTMVFEEVPKTPTFEEFFDLKNIEIRQKASHDNEILLPILRDLNQPSQSNSKQHQLASFLLHIYGGSSSDSRAWEVSFESLEKEEKLGAGVSGTVYKTRWLGAVVAVKVFYGGPNNLDFTKEKNVLARLSHPNIISLYCLAVDNQRKRCAIVMELMDENLFSLIKRRVRQSPSSPPFTDLDSICLMLQIAEGVQYLHENKVVHRDLNSYNILVKHVKTTSKVKIGYVHAKLSAFGLSKTMDIGDNDKVLDVGTTRWMAPEIISLVRQEEFPTKVNVDLYKSDVFSFGMVCYEILNGGVPFSTITNPKEVKKLVLTGVRPQLSKLCPFKLKALIEKCWHQKPSIRPPFSDICIELRHLKWLLMSGM